MNETVVSPGSKWYQRNWVVILSLISFAPLGIFLTWKYAGWGKATKIIASLASALYFIFVWVAILSAPPTIVLDNVKDNRVSTDEATYTLKGEAQAFGDIIVTVNDKPAQINGTKFSAVVDLKEGDNTVVVVAKKGDKSASETFIIHRNTAAEVAAKKAESDKKAAEDAAAQKSKEQAPAKASNTPTPASTATVSQKNALQKAKDYLSYTAFSHDGLVNQLVYEKFSSADATYGADNVGANWNEQAAKKAKDYMGYSYFSRGSLIAQLEYDKFTPDQAAYGANAVGL